MKDIEILTVGTYKAFRSDIEKASLNARKKKSTLSAEIKKFVEELAKQKIK